jgi:hypothetical protein
MRIKDRVKEFRRVRARDLIPNEKNWRRHPQPQRDALLGILSEIGYADALIARETPDGLTLIDGHLRAETTPDMEVPVLILDVTEEEADKLLLSLDPLGAMAESDRDALAGLLSTVESESVAVKNLFARIAQEAGIDPPDFDMATLGDQQRLDEKKKVACPQCGCEFVP